MLLNKTDAIIRILSNINASFTVKAPNTAHLSLLTSIGYNNKETNLKVFSQLNKVVIILYLHKVQKEKYCLDI